MHTPRVVAASTCLAALITLQSAARAQVMRDALWQPNGTVNATAYANGTVYVGGSFTHIAPITGSLAGFDATTGALVGPPIAVDGRVNSIVSDGAGGWYVGGLFTRVQGQSRASLAHLDASGKVTAWNPGTDGQVYALAFDALHPRQVFVSGYFTTLGGQSRSNLGAVDATTGSATTWQPTLGVAVGVPQVYALQTRVGLVYLGGAFDHVDGVYRFNAATLDTNGVLQAFAPDINGTVRAIAIRALVKAPFTVTEYVGGDFTRLNGQTANHLGALDAGTGVTDTYAASLDGPVNALTLSVSNLGAVTVWAGGAFTFANGTGRNNLAAFDAAGNLTSWNPSANDAVKALVYAGGILWTGGLFKGAGGAARYHLAAITTAGAATAWDPAPDSTVSAIGLWGSTILAGGQFNIAGGVPRRNLAALGVADGLPTSWDPNPRGQVTSLLVDGSNLYVGGQFDSIGGHVRSGAAQLALSSGTATAWAPAMNGPVTQFLLHKGRVYVAGPFSMIGAQTRVGVGAIDAAGQPTSWNPPSVTGTVRALAADGVSIFLGGDFDLVGGMTRSGLAAVDDSLGTMRGFAPTLTNSAGGSPRVNALFLSGPELFVGGTFTGIDAMTCTDFGVTDTLFGAPILPEPGSNGPPYVFSPLGSTLFIGGALSGIGGTATGSVGSLDLPSRTVLSWDPDLRGEVHALAAGGGSVFAGGLFQGTWAQAGAPPLQTRLVAISTTVAGVGSPGAGAARSVATLQVEPNPSGAPMALRFSLPRAGPVTLEVLDVTGRRVYVRDRIAGAAGEQSVPWDGRDAVGVRVPAGLYLVHVRAGELTLTAKAVRLE